MIIILGQQTFPAEDPLATLSGLFWVDWAETNAPNSRNVGDLAAPFRDHVGNFIGALKAAGATVRVTATKRSALRAYLFHWSWLIALGRAHPSDPPPEPGVDIQWDHGDLDRSRAGARAMVNGFGLAVPPASRNAPSLTSLHIFGRAIDMDITWEGTIQVRQSDGQAATIAFMQDQNQNVALHRVGESYGVLKLTTDEPHWSDTGH